MTKWIRQNWSPEKLGWDDYEYAMVVARFLNWPDTLARIVHHGGVMQPSSIANVLAGVDGKIWGNAYVITTHGIPMGKAAYLCERVLPPAYTLLGAGRWRGVYGSRPLLRARATQLQELEGVGSFLGAQIIADLKNTVDHPLYNAGDWAGWSAPGPGSLRGLGWFYGHAITEGKFEGAMNGVFDYMSGHEEIDLIFTGDRPNMQDLQNCLCEYDKYMRVKNGTGRSKRNYPGAA